MNNKGQLHSKELQIQGLLDNFLRLKTSNNVFESESSHLDEDFLATFVEGTLTKNEAKPITNHLVKCSYCRHITAELIKLDYAFAEDEQPVKIPESQPTKVSEVLNGVLSRIFGTADSAVFAHQESEEKKDIPSEKETNEE